MTPLPIFLFILFMAIGCGSENYPTSDLNSQNALNSEKQPLDLEIRFYPKNIHATPGSKVSFKVYRWRYQPSFSGRNCELNDDLDLFVWHTDLKNEVDHEKHSISVQVPETPGVYKMIFSLKEDDSISEELIIISTENPSNYSPPFLDPCL